MAEIFYSGSTNLNDESSLPRRTANHHGNVWDDDLIQSLNSPYGAPAYYEEVEKLVGEIKHLLVNEMDDSNEDLIKRLQMVDILECLGIDRHFRPEIEIAALDYVYRCWNEGGIGVGSRDSCKDLNATALGFRALRLHRYNVYSGVLENFKDESGKFISNFTGDKRVRSMLSLLRASEISFPGEKVMEEAMKFHLQGGGEAQKLRSSIFIGSVTWNFTFGQSQASSSPSFLVAELPSQNFVSSQPF